MKASELLSDIWQNTPVSVILRRGSLRNMEQVMYQSLCTSPLPARTLIMKCLGRKFRDVLHKLIKEDKFFTEAEQDAFEHIDPVVMICSPYERQ